MATRDDILRELRLAPLWRQRTSPGLGHAATFGSAPDLTPATAVVGRSTPVHPDAQARNSVLSAADSLAQERRAAENTDVRRERIAALTWPIFAADVASCTACGLCQTRNKPVPGVGDINAEWLFVGEAPGSEEDAKGEPFVGQAGRLLDNMLAALGLARGANVYIANVQKCRPPGNRTPALAEIEACRPYLDRQIALIRPKLIVALGKSAATTLLGAAATIASLRGRVHRYRDVPLVVTYHPAYLLRTLLDKPKAWEDLLLARRTMTRLKAKDGAAGVD